MPSSLHARRDLTLIGAIPRRIQRRLQIGRFRGDFRRYRSALSVSGDTCGLSGSIFASVSASKIPFPAAGVSTAMPFGRPGILESGGKGIVLGAVRNYCGFSPRASNCWLHSAGASRSRPTPTPRGNDLDRGPHEIWFEERGGRHQFGSAARR